MKRLVTGMGIVAGQLLHAAHRRDLPSHENQDPSGDFGSRDRPSLRVVLLGDSSITAPGVEPIDLSWPRRIASDLASHYFVELRSVAVGGARALHVLRDQVDAALALHGDMALISVGANDALRAVPVRDYERAIDEILRRLTAAVPAVGISGVGDLGSVPRLPTVARSWATVRSRAFNRAIARAASRHGVAKSETWGPLWKPFSTGDPAFFAPDQFHASAAGHAIFAAAMGPVVETLLDQLEPALSDRRGSRGSST